MPLPRKTKGSVNKKVCDVQKQIEWYRNIYFENDNKGDIWNHTVKHKILSEISLNDIIKIILINT